MEANTVSVLSLDIKYIDLKNGLRLCLSFSNLRVKPSIGRYSMYVIDGVQSVFYLWLGDRRSSEDFLDHARSLHPTHIHRVPCWCVRTSRDISVKTHETITMHAWMWWAATDSIVPISYRPMLASLIRYDTKAEFNMDSKAEWSA